MDLFKWQLRGIARRRETKNSYTLLKTIFACRYSGESKILTQKRAHILLV